MKTLALIALTLVTATSAHAAQSPAQTEASKAISKLSEIVQTRANYDVKGMQYEPIGDFLLSECVTMSKGLQLFLRDAPEVSDRQFVNKTPYDTTTLYVIDKHPQTFDNGQEKFDGIESGFIFNRMAEGTPDSGDLILGSVSVRVWEKAGMKTRVYINCVADSKSTSGYPE